MRKISKKRQQQLKEEEKERIKMKLLFFYCWNEWDKKSEISGTQVFGEASTAYHHHILPKSSYPEVKYLPYNIINITLEEHTECENDPDRYLIVISRRKEILENYEHYSRIAKDFELNVLEPLYELSKDLINESKNNRPI